MMALYTNEGNGLFIDEAPTSTIGQASLLTLTFACFFFDYDLDGLLDIFAANGHVADDISAVQPQRDATRSRRTCSATSAASASRRSTARVGRGVPAADGRRAAPPTATTTTTATSICSITTNNGPARLLRNDGGERNRALRVTLVGTTSNRDGDRRARRACTLADGAPPWRDGEDRLELPVAERAAADVRPRRGGEGHRRSRSPGRAARTETLAGVDARTSRITIEEGKGIVRARPLGAQVMPRRRVAACRRRLAVVAGVAWLVPASSAAAPAPPARDVAKHAYRANNLGVALLEQFDYDGGGARVPRGAAARTRRSTSRALNLAIALFYGGEPPRRAAEARAAAERAAGDRRRPTTCSA